ncbi:MULTISPECIES: hypothetical protein [Providencia]|uniref:hypothetical protein n=1 Tax=Providencia TaxID=586 RepID=UPI001981C503|nr:MULTISPECIES: hypothetical protein [Providencia]MBN4867729.1 hypothetical protein [Providencia stuartii]MBN4877226.1 hypothetical protein [Providencia stuartii]MBN4881737.1 hypothetical protein [Providencia stuartii]MBN4886243.1 hypothetical protein [Providencia stuartii]
MTKTTDLDTLLDTWGREEKLILRKMHTAAGRPNRKRFTSINASRLMRKYRNRKDCMYAEKVAYRLSEICFMTELIKNNREQAGLPTYIFTFGNSGTAKSQREASNAGN